MVSEPARSHSGGETIYADFCGLSSLEVVERDLPVALDERLEHLANHIAKFGDVPFIR